MQYSPDNFVNSLEVPCAEYLVQQTIEVPDQEQIGEVDVWVPIPFNATCLLITNSPTTQTEDLGLGCKLLYFENVVCPFSINISYSHDGKPRVPLIAEDFIDNCLQISEDFTGKLPPLTQLKVSLARTSREKVMLISNFLMSNLGYEFPPSNPRDAASVFKCMKSDCGGYHNLFVEFLRRNGIPAVIDFGFRFPNLEPHAWAWWFDRKTNTWIIEDLNDRIAGTFVNGNCSPRLSMTLGYGQILTPPFPRDVLFLQEKLYWDRNYDSREKKIRVESSLSSERF